MTPINYRKRFLLAFLTAVVLGVLFGLVGHAQDDDTIVYEPYDWCRNLEPYGYWWYFWDCRVENGQ